MTTERAAARLRVPGRVVVATGRDPRAHPRACQAVRGAAGAHRLSVRTTGECVGVGPVAVPETATAVEFAPDKETTAEGTPVRRVDGDGPRRVVVTDPSGLIAAVSNAALGSDGPLSVCVDSLRPIRRRGTDDDLFWVLRTIGSVLSGREWDCHIHHPVAPEASLPPALEHLIDDRVALSKRRPSTGTGTEPRGEPVSD